MATHRYLWSGIAALGFASGMVIAKVSKTPQKVPAGPEAVETSDSRPVETRATPAPAVPPVPLPVSTDTIESLLAADKATQYARLGLWLIDASAQDMEAFWDAYIKLGPTNEWITELVFTQWAKKDVRRLFEIAKRDKKEGTAWWAWAMSDPDAALAASEDASMEMRGFALRGVANFHPERAMKILQEHPELASILAVDDLAEELGKRDPRKGLELLAKYNTYSVGGMLGLWAEEDPRAALAWLTERDNDADLRSEFVASLARSNPEMLAELAAELPSGATKREFEMAALMKLAESDPAKAIEAASKEQSPVLAAERMAKIGSIIAANDPDKAMEVLGQILAKCPDAAYKMKFSRTPNGGGSASGAIPAFDPLLRSLARSNPELTMETVLAAERDQAALPSSPYSPIGSQRVASQWAAQDLDGFIRWTDAQQDPKTLDSSAAVISQEFTGKKDFESAFAWSERITDRDKRVASLTQTIIQWSGSDPATAASWMKKANLPAPTRAMLEQRYLAPTK